jgi:hypothetical protein
MRRQAEQARNHVSLKITINVIKCRDKYQGGEELLRRTEHAQRPCSLLLSFIKNDQRIFWAFIPVRDFVFSFSVTVQYITPS